MMHIRRIFVLAAVGAAWLAVSAAQSEASVPSPPPGWVLIGHGIRQGTMWQGVVPGAGTAELYLPPPGQSDHYPIVYVDGNRPAVKLVSDIGLPDVADELIWDGTAPPFATLVVDAPPSVILRTVEPWARRTLPLAPDQRATLVGIGSESSPALRAAVTSPGLVRTVAAIGSPPSSAVEGADAVLVHRAAPSLQRHHFRMFLVSDRRQSRAATGRSRQFAQVLSSLALRHATAIVPRETDGSLSRAGFRLALPYALTAVRVQQATASASSVLPRAWVQILSGPHGGTVWQGLIPNSVLPGARRDSLVYLPPNASRSHRYPIVYLLHGLRGSPYSFVGGLRLAAIADNLITGGRVPPFIAVMPPAGRTIAFDGEWTGAWEHYVTGDVVPWAHRHLPVRTTAAAASLAGFSAGGYGALDIGLRHPGLFGTLESWSGYFQAPHDGSLAGATASELAQHDPTLLTRDSASSLREGQVRVYLAAGEKERVTLAQTRRYAALLTKLSIDHRLVATAGGHVGWTWRVQLARALTYALNPRRAAETQRLSAPAH
jgi:enterochelin esterase-like enzyme